MKMKSDIIEKYVREFIAEDSIKERNLIFTKYLYSEFKKLISIEFDIDNKYGVYNDFDKDTMIYEIIPIIYEKIINFNPNKGSGSACSYIRIIVRCQLRNIHSETIRHNKRMVGLDFYKNIEDSIYI